MKRATLTGAVSPANPGTCSLCLPGLWLIHAVQPHELLGTAVVPFYRPGDDHTQGFLGKELM